MQSRIATQRNIDFAVLRGATVENLLSKLSEDKYYERWRTAINKAIEELEENDLAIWDGRELQICSRESNNLYRVIADFCQCTGLKKRFRVITERL